MASRFTSMLEDAALAWLAASSYAVEYGAKMAVGGRERPNPAHSHRQEGRPCL